MLESPIEISRQEIEARHNPLHFPGDFPLKKIFYQQMNREQEKAESVLVVSPVIFGGFILVKWEKVFRSRSRKI
jgi:hypothetical protein